jgi:hypothetical protein
MTRRWLPVVIGAFLIEVVWLIMWLVDPGLLWQSVS